MSDYAALIRPTFITLIPTDINGINHITYEIFRLDPFRLRGIAFSKPVLNCPLSSILYSREVMWSRPGFPARSLPGLRQGSVGSPYAFELPLAGQVSLRNEVPAL